MAAGGLIPLPMIKNGKTVDPKVRNQPSRRQTHTARSIGRAAPFTAHTGGGQGRDSACRMS